MVAEGAGVCEKRLANATEMTFVTIFFPPPWHCFVSQVLRLECPEQG